MANDLGDDEPTLTRLPDVETRKDVPCGPLGPLGPSILAAKLEAANAPKPTQAPPSKSAEETLMGALVHPPGTALPFRAQSGVSPYIQPSGGQPQAGKENRAGETWVGVRVGPDPLVATFGIGNGFVDPAPSRDSLSRTSPWARGLGTKLEAFYRAHEDGERKGPRYGIGSGGGQFDEFRALLLTDEVLARAMVYQEMILEDRQRKAWGGFDAKGREISRIDCIGRAFRDSLQGNFPSANEGERRQIEVREARIAECLARMGSWSKADRTRARRSILLDETCGVFIPHFLETMKQHAQKSLSEQPSFDSLTSAIFLGYRDALISPQSSGTVIMGGPQPIPNPACSVLPVFVKGRMSNEGK